MPRPTTRFEVKYRLSPEHAAAVRKHIERHMEPDQFGEGGGATYSVHSLYFDGPDLSIYWDTELGNYERFKIRARCYVFSPDAPMFLEVKHRSGEAMWKTRAPVPREECLRLLRGGAPDVPPSPALDNFMMWVDRRRAVPVSWITYRRRAYVGGDRELVRVTFDTQIKVAPPTDDLGEPPQWFELPETHGIEVLELKYSGSYPAWLAETIRRFDLDRKSYSKYKFGIDELQRRGLVGRAARPPGAPRSRRTSREVA